MQWRSYVGTNPGPGPPSFLPYTLDFRLISDQKYTSMLPFNCWPAHVSCSSSASAWMVGVEWALNNQWSKSYSKILTGIVVCM
jgi:hypothetical protein